MVKILTEYKGELHCEAVHEPSGERLGTDAPKDNMGKGETFSPTDLLTTSLTTCIATLMGIQANMLKLDISGMKIDAEKEMSKDLPRRVAKFTIVVRVPQEFDEKTRGRLERAAGNCPVYHSLHPDIEKDLKFVWGSE